MTENKYAVKCAVLSRLLNDFGSAGSGIFDSGLKIESQKQKDFDKREIGCIMASSFGVVASEGCSEGQRF